ncbi:MAG: HNH endonuclease, partial [bacterium]
KKDYAIFLFCFLGGGMFFIVQRILCSRKIPYLPPPDVPRKEHKSLSSSLDVVYDEEFIAKENPEFLKVKGYPPDWEERQRNCLIRDEYKCRICQGKKRLHIHHIKPISFGGIHSLQNLITLCSSCHKAQEYYKHQGLIAENIKASRRYWVSPHTRFDGRKISGYLRKTGRRGLFWRKVKRTRSA